MSFKANETSPFFAPDANGGQQVPDPIFQDKLRNKNWFVEARFWCNGYKQSGRGECGWTKAAKTCESITLTCLFLEWVIEVSTDS